MLQFPSVKRKILGVVLSLLFSICGSPCFSDSPNVIEITQTCAGEQDIIQCLRGLTIEHPRNAELREYIALALFQNGDSKGALIEIDEALLINPGDIDLHVFRAQLLKDLGDFESAQIEGEQIRSLKREQREKLLSEPVEDVDELRVHAHLADLSGDYKVASALYQRYLESIDVPDYQSMCSYAKVLARQNLAEEALQAIDGAFESVEEDDYRARASIWRTSASVKRILGDEIGADSDMLEFQRCMDRQEEE